MSEIMVVGDTHGDVPFIQKRLQECYEQKVRWMIQLGDFGLWPNAGGELDTAFLKEVDDFAHFYGVTLVFIDGNHDWSDEARNLYPADRISGMRPLGTALFWADRGTVFNIEGVSFAALGGAVSSDRDRREIHFEDEMTTRNDLDVLFHHTKNMSSLDVLLTHEAPAECVIPDVHPFGGKLGADITANRSLLSEAVQKLRPKHVWHGHHHYGYRTMINLGDTITKVQGYASNVEDDHSSYGFWDLDSLDNPYQSVFVTQA